MPYKTIPVSEDLFKDLQKIKKKTEKRLGFNISWDVFIQDLCSDDDSVVASAIRSSKKEVN